MRKIDIHLLNDLQRREIRERTREQVSNEHSFFCVCGKLCTGLHEQRCAKFNNKVQARFEKNCREEIVRLGLDKKGVVRGTYYEKTDKVQEDQDKIRNGHEND